MEIRVRVESADGAESGELTRALADWLAEDRDVGRYAEIGRIRHRETRPSGAMSADPMTWVQLLTSSGFSTAGLVYAHMAFRASLPRRQRSVPVVIECRGVRVTVRDASPETAARIAEVLAAPEPGGGDAEPDGREDGR
ncbi:hypothetical protein HUT18_20045 [Streptomyces sp. NA04227]|uniref:effector-associated constant component EACC1 n=1 Tax=Streptomyces sp. NA04227 TaxID=2742136 RepID=UPI001591F574|nr:hypothetical protein [Streptomyces sp. NA04227]QKW08320.1 hypothetical protein HUT18_20045 [Streptomyces sp. NA04227]